MPPKERQPSDRPDYRPLSPDPRSVQFREGVGSGGGSPYDHPGYNPSGLEFGSDGGGYKSLFDERKNPLPPRRRGLPADRIRDGGIRDPRIGRIAELVDELVEAGVAETTEELTAELQTAKDTMATQALRMSELRRSEQGLQDDLAEVTASALKSESRVRELERENERLRREASTRTRASEPASLNWDPKGYYRILGINDPSVASRITSSQIDRLFRAQADVYHPDHDGGSDDHMKKLSAARDHLKDPLNRRSYGR